MSFAVLDASGNLVVVENDLDAAIARAGRDIYLGDAIETREGSLSGLDAAAATDMPRLALQSTHVEPMDFDSIMQVSVEEAYRVFVSLYPPQRPDGRKIQYLASSRGVVEHFLGQNYKTAKKTKEEPSLVQGLSLLPFWNLRDRQTGEVDPKHKKLYTKLAQLRPAPATQTSKSFNLCVGSSPDCRQFCLAYSGNNEIDDFNIWAKTAYTEMFLNRPKAFMRLLVAALEYWTKRAEKSGEYELFIRLNVLSDVPWELVCPDLFEHFSSTRFYDYTKVPGRNPPANYDLSFSYSGVNGDYVDYELARGRRVVVVFLPERKYKGAEILAQPGIGLPKKFYGYDVVDGDISDLRPRDPAPGIVGLRWKIPMYAGVGYKPPRMKFVVPIEEAEGQRIIGVSASQTPVAQEPTI